MTRKEYKEYINKADTGLLADEQNPAFLFTGISTDLLIKIAKGEIDPKEIAKRELENRGRDINGHWVGFNNEIN